MNPLRLPRELAPRFGLDEVELVLPGTDRRRAWVFTVIALAALAAWLSFAMNQLIDGAFTGSEDFPQPPPPRTAMTWVVPAIAVLVPGLPLGLWLGKPPPRLVLSAVGLMVNDRRLRWSDVLDVEARDDGVVLFTTGEPVHLPTGRGSRSVSEPLAEVCRTLARSAEGEAPALLLALRDTAAE
ncbi:MAG: hypothetical protein EP330_21955 [Deltaproteobacteria bacterium]|nr:MAG: hypothetical protein EP330_21955 [Deltaproteobacteria bacterium]